jgi:hypothetical protein
VANFLEIANLTTNVTLLRRVESAISIKAQTLLDLPTPTANQLAFASNALKAPETFSSRILRYILAVNNSAAPTVITGVGDAAIANNVNTAIDKFIAGGIVS